MEPKNFSAAIIVRNDEVLVQKKSSEYRIPRVWAFFGGGIEKGETPEQALKREMIEELGWKIEEFKLFKTIEFEGGRKGYYFIAPFNIKLSDIKLNEGIGFVFMTKEELEELNMNEFDQKIIQEYYNDN